MNFGELIAKGGALFARKGADALADTLETAPAADLARIQASVSGDGATWIPPIVGNGVADDSGVINATIVSAAAATSGGVVTIKLREGAIVKVSSPIVLRTNVTLDLSGVKLVHGAGVPVITNRARLAPPLRSFSDAVLVVGQSHVDSAAAAFTAADIGKSFFCATGSASPENFHFTAKIISVASPTRANLEWSPGAAVTGGSGKILDRDQNIFIKGDERTEIFRAVPSSTNDNNEQSTLLTRVDNLHISGIKYTSTASKYGFLVSDVRGFSFRKIRVYCNADGIHVTGPAIDGVIEDISGISHDDFVALGCMDYVPYCDTQGPLRNIEVRRLTSEGGKGFHLFGGAKDAAISAKTITVDGVYGPYTAAPVNVEAGSGDALTVVDDIVVRNIRPSSTNNYAHVLVGSSTGQNMGTVKIDGLYDDGASGAGTVPNIVVQANCNAIQVSGVVRTTKSKASAVLSISNAATTVGSIKFSGLQANFGASNADIVSINGQFKALVFDGAAIAGHSGVKLVSIGTQTGATIHAANMLATGMSGAYLWWLNGVIDLNLTNVAFGACYMAVRAASSGSVVTVRGSGITWSPTIAMEGVSGSTVHPKSFALTGEADRPNISKAPGNSMYNTKAGLSCGAGYIVADGAAYKNLYSGATY